jgi:acid stress chaperone HdeB
MTRILAFIMMSAFLIPLPAEAETVDLATVKCSELADMKAEDASFMFAWMLGYAGGQTSTTTLDLSGMDALGNDIGEYCAANPDVGLLSAATEVMSR